MRRSRYIQGPPLCGFWSFNERDYGDPATPRPYVVIAPSRIGRALLPFLCPRCNRVIDFGDKQARRDYCDRRTGNGNHWCPHCGYRFRLDARGVPLAQSLPAGATHAPAHVNGKVVKMTFADEHRAGIDILGAITETDEDIPPPDPDPEVEVEDEDDGTDGMFESLTDYASDPTDVEEALDAAEDAQADGGGDDAWWEAAAAYGGGGGGGGEPIVTVTPVPGPEAAALPARTVRNTAALRASARMMAPFRMANPLRRVPAA